MPQTAPATQTQLSNTFYEQTFAEWQAPIEFYGRVLDESNAPVSGARIRFSWTDLTADEHRRMSATESDGVGLFSLRHAQGASLTVWVSKDGYYAAGGGQKGFSYALTGAKFFPDPQNPVVFFLRKKGQGVELITSANGVRQNLGIRVPKDGAPVRVDFFQKQATSTGQLEIRQNKPPWREAAEWSFRISIPDGGFVENGDEFQFEAPESNYQPTVEYHFTKGETNWTTQVVKQFYIAFGQPRKYGWLRIESNLGQETVILTYAINPSGSRNLEPAN